MTYTLVAVVTNAQTAGEMDTATFDRIEDAEERMARWAKYGVEGQCDEPAELAIFDSEDQLVRQWHWRRGRPFDPRTAAAADPVSAQSDAD